MTTALIKSRSNRRSRKQRLAQQGYSLIELMVTIAIVAVMASYALPNFSDLSLKNNANTHRRLVASALQGAQRLASDGNTPITICATTTQTECTAGADWHSGWMVFRDINGDGAFGTGDVIVGLNEPMKERINITQVEGLTFLPNGRLGELRSYEFIICPAPDADSSIDLDRYARAVYVSPMGIVRLSQDTDADGIHNSEQIDLIDGAQQGAGGNLTCP